MSRSTRKNPCDTFDALVQRLQRGKPQPTPKPQHLVAHTIKRRPEVFQHRRPAKHLSDAHIRALADAARAQDLDPLTVWWDGQSWTLIDGHHRIQAYARAGKSMNAVPIEVFEGSLEEALTRAASANSKAKLPMTSSEKSTAAWRMVVLVPKMSKSAQAIAAGVSERLVASMRSAKSTLLAQQWEPSELVEMTWERARRAAKGQDADDWTPEEEEQRVEQMALAMRKALGATAERQPDIFWRAIEVYSPQLARALLDHLEERREESAEDIEEIEE